MGGTVSTEHAGDIHIPSHPTASNTLSQHDGPLRSSRDSVDPQSGPMFAQERDTGRGKRKLPSPEGRVRQNSLPQPQTGKERWQEGGEEEEEQRGLSGEGQMSENYQKNQDHQQSSLGKNKEWNDLLNKMNPSGDDGPLHWFYRSVPLTLLLGCSVITSGWSLNSYWWTLHVAPALLDSAAVPCGRTSSARRHPGLFQSEQMDELNDVTARHMSIKER